MRHTLAMITVDISRVSNILEKKPTVIENAIEHWPKRYNAPRFGVNAKLFKRLFLKILLNKL